MKINALFHFPVQFYALGKTTQAQKWFELNVNISVLACSHANMFSRHNIGLTPESRSIESSVGDPSVDRDSFFFFFWSVSVHFSNRIKQMEAAFPIHRLYLGGPPR